MVARKLLTVTAVGLTLSLLGEPSASAQAERVQKAPPVQLVDAQVFRAEIDGYVREHNRRMRATLNEDLRRELAPKVVLVVNELRTTS
jgi:hypothetical protein